MLYKLKQRMLRLVFVISNIAFSLRLRLLNLRYGKGNIPQDKLPPVLVGTEEDKLMVVRLLKVVGYVTVFSDHYNVDPDNSYTRNLLGALIASRFENEEQEKEALDLLSRADHARVVLKYMLDNGDIAKHKYAYYKHPTAYKSEDEWLDHMSKIGVERPDSE